MKRFFTFLKTELKLSLRDMNMVIFAIIMPLVIFIIIGIIYGTKPAYMTVRTIHSGSSLSEPSAQLPFVQADLWACRWQYQAYEK